MATDKDFVESVVNNNAKHIATLQTEEEVKSWLSAMLYSAIGFARNSTNKINMTREDWLNICRLYQTWYYIQMFDSKDEALEYAKTHMPDDSVFDDGRIEFFVENLQK